MATGVSERAGEKWADTLQDGTMQGLAALRMLLASGISRSPEALERAATEAVRQLDDEIGDLRVLIAEMRRQEARRCRRQAHLID
jgi:signal transduction histidine kinase